VSTEMEQYQVQWENELDNLETRSSILLVIFSLNRIVFGMSMLRY
jgi:hypothetical protein